MKQPMILMAICTLTALSSALAGNESGHGTYANKEQFVQEEELRIVQMAERMKGIGEKITQSFPDPEDDSRCDLSVLNEAVKYFSLDPATDHESLQELVSAVEIFEIYSDYGPLSAIEKSKEQGSDPLRAMEKVFAMVVNYVSLSDAARTAIKWKKVNHPR